MKPSANRLEYQQLERIFALEAEAERSKPTLRTRLENIWQSLIERLTALPELRVWHTYDNEGNIWWSAHNPKTGRSICQISEEQMRVWIEQRY